MKILDATAGFRMMHFNKNNPNIVYLDIRDDTQLAADLQRVPNRKPWKPIVPTTQGDYRNLPFPDDYFDQIYFDPSHLIHVGKTGIYYVKYGKLSESWREDIAAGAKELFRVLKPGHALDFKWCTQDIGLNDVLALFPVKPIVGQKTVGGQGCNRGKPRTFWLSFVKDDSQ